MDLHVLLDADMITAVFKELEQDGEFCMEAGKRSYVRKKSTKSFEKEVEQEAVEQSD